MQIWDSKDSKQSTTEGQRQASANFTPALVKRYRIDLVFATLTWVATFVAVLVLLVLLVDVFFDGAPRLFGNDGGIPLIRDRDFLWSFPSRNAEEAGIKSALVGTLWLLMVTAIMAFPLGVASGIFLEEFATETWYARLIEINIGNLAAVPSIIYGLLGLFVFVNVMRPLTGGNSVVSGGLTMALLIVPIIIVGTREALRAVPDSLRQAGFALGANRWQVVWNHVLPQAFPGILTGTILALSRAIGETAPLIAVGAAVYVPFLPKGITDSYTALPIQIYNWSSRPQDEFRVNAAAAIIVLMVVLLLMNATAIYLRNRFQTSRN
jgi:phosphate transport system permease protein